jgi:very-short-patch-repair endonuclease
MRGARTPVGGSRLEALGAMLAPDQAFTSVTAAKLWRMPLPRRWERDPRFWVSTLSRDRSMRRAEVVPSRRMEGGVIRVDGLPVLEPARVWSSLARLLDIHDLVAVADRIVTTSPRLRALAPVADLVEMVEAMGERRGVRALRASLSEVREGAWSRPESLLRLALVRSGIPEPALNRQVPVARGRTAAPDIGWQEFRVGVEYDGAWHDDPRQRSADLERHELLADAGWLVVHIRARDLFPEPLVAVARILRRLSERGYRHPSPIERAVLPSLLP